MQNSDLYWERGTEKLEDMSRQQKLLHKERVKARNVEERKRKKTEEGQALTPADDLASPDEDEGGAGLPNLYFTIAPAEWKSNYHRGVQQWCKEAGCSVSQAQAAMTFHLHHVIGAVLREIILKKGSGLTEGVFKKRAEVGTEEVYEYSPRRHRIVQRRVEFVLAENVFIAKTPNNTRFIVHPIAINGKKFLPFAYGYAMTIRRAQGSTLEQVCLWFDHRYPADRGYAYVGSSRVRFATDLSLMGKAKRTDWLPVGGDETCEQTTRGYDSATAEEDSEEASGDEPSSGLEGPQSSGDQGSSDGQDSGGEEPGSPGSDNEVHGVFLDDGRQSEDYGQERD